MNEPHSPVVRERVVDADPVGDLAADLVAAQQRGVAEVWPLIDELTAAHGIVTSLIGPGYRERSGDTVHGSLDLA